MEDGLLFGLQKWGEYGMRRFSCTLQPNEKRRIPIIIPSGRWWLVYRYRFGDIVTDTLDFRFDSVRNYFEEDIRITTELLNDTTWPKPYISISGTSAAIVITNTTAVERDFSIVLDFIVIDNEIMGHIRELILAEREKFRGKVTEQVGTGGA